VYFSSHHQLPHLWERLARQAMSSRRDTSPLPSDPGELRDLISQLSDDLALQRTIYESLKELTMDTEIEAQLNDVKAEIKSIQRRLAEARRVQHHGKSHHLLSVHLRVTMLLTSYSAAKQPRKLPNPGRQHRPHHKDRIRLPAETSVKVRLPFTPLMPRLPPAVHRIPRPPTLD
jgi:hypothetical protein